MTHQSWFFPETMRALSDNITALAERLNGPTRNEGRTFIRDRLPNPQEPIPAVAERQTLQPSFPAAEQIGKPTCLAITQRAAENTAVAEETKKKKETAVEWIKNPKAFAWASEKDSTCPSIPGDEIDPALAPMSDESDGAFETRLSQRRAPASTYDGEIAPTKKSSKWNAEPEVGNFGLFFGNWGKRSPLACKTEQKQRNEKSDKQILKNPGQIVVLCEATQEVEDLLKESRSRGDPTAEEGTLDARDEHDHYVIRGREDTSVLIAARKDVTTGIHLCHWEILEHPYRDNGKDQIARTRIMIARVSFKQNIGHMGMNIVVAGVHGHYRVMKCEWAQAIKRAWDTLADKLRSHGAQMMAGDFNMSNTQVVVEMRKRGLICDCIAWYPWNHATLRTHGQALGLDS